MLCGDSSVIQNKELLVVVTRVTFRTGQSIPVVGKVLGGDNDTRFWGITGGRGAQHIWFAPHVTVGIHLSVAMDR